MKRAIFIGCVLLIAAFWLATTLRGQRPQTNDLKDFMRAKLLHSQKLVEGLTTENYEMIAKHAQDLSLLCEDEQWQVFRTSDYIARSKEFRRATDALTEAGRAKNLDAASLGYVDVTLKCVECHKYLRTIRK
jgi:hypothetical protein